MADNKQMKLKIEYDNINNAEKPIQSLVNFFTNNCVLRMLNKIEAEDTDPDSINIDTRLIANIINDSKLDDSRTVIASIKYENKSDGSTDGALVQKNGTNPIIDCDTKFVKVNTALKFYEMYHSIDASDGAEFVEANVELLPGMIEIPVIITPYYDGKENTDEDIIPIFEADDPGTEDIDESIIQNYKIQKNDLTVDWKLRTTTFTLQSDDVYYDVFYKVGFCPADGKESTEKEIISALKLYAFMIECDDSIFSLRYPEWSEYKFDHQMQITLKPMWFPLYKYDDNGDATLEGITYIELYNSEDGSKFTDDIKEFRAMINHDNDCNYFYAPLKDYMLDKGNIPSVYYNVPS